MRLFLLGLLVCLLPGLAAAQRQAGGETCTAYPLPEDMGFTGTERWVWDQVCLGRVAVLAEHAGDGLGCDAKSEEAEEWGEARRLSARFLRFMATNEQLARTATRPAMQHSLRGD